MTYFDIGIENKGDVIMRYDHTGESRVENAAELRQKKRKLIISAAIMTVIFIVVLVGVGIHNKNANRVKMQSGSENSNLPEPNHEQTVMEVDKQPDLETELTDHLQDNMVAEEDESDPVMAMYQQYYDKLIEFQNQYGMCEVVSEDIDDPFLEENCYLKGLCFAKLIDFDADGIEELILAYHTGQTADDAFFQNYIIEIWSYQNSAIRKVYSGEPMIEGEGALGIHVSSLDGKYYLYNYMEEFDEETYESHYIDEWRGLDGGVVDVLKRDIWEIAYSDDGETEIYSIDDKDVTKKEWMEDRERWTDLEGDYGLQNGGSTLETSVSELAATFKTLSAYLGIEWEDNISWEREEKPYSESAWKAELIGHWETLNPKSFAEWTTLTFYEDGMAELHTRSGVCFGSFEIQSDGSVMLYAKDEYMYDNAEAHWLYAESDVQIQLTMGSNMYEMNYTYIDGMGEGSFPDSVVLNRVEEEGVDYSSAEKAVQYYEKEISQ